MIEWARVNELRDEFGEDDFQEVVELFLDEVEEVINRLRSKPKPEQLEDDLHFLKGSALNLGFRSFSRLCQHGERESARGRAAMVDLRPIMESYEVSKRQFVDGLGMGQQSLARSVKSQTAPLSHLQ